MVSRLEDVKNAKIEKYNELKKEKYDPYSIEKFDKQFDVEELKRKYEKIKTGETSKESVKTAGRIMAIRGHGKLFFMDLQEGSGKIQIILKQDSAKNFDDNKYLGIGDFIGVEGKITKTNAGELSIVVANFQILSKNILPLPEKWHGLVDDEERLRKRYLDILMNPEIREIFLKKAKFWNNIRQFLLERDFLEVETPVLETSAGGASATPFKTHHNALNIDVFLRISMGELWQKKLMVAGFEKTFEIGRQFRNEGMDIEHLQDYTQMEFYWAYADYKDGMKLVEEMYKKIAKDVFGNTKFETHGYTVDFAKEWELFDYESTIKKHTGIDIYKADEKEIKKKLTELKIEFDPKVDKWRLVDILWKFCRKKLSGPGFLVGQPVEISPLAKRDPKDKRKVHQFQVIIAGSEIGNGYSELNDPFDQEERFKIQQEMKTKGDTEAQDHDFSFVEALQYGMPPTCGFGVSERLFSFLMNKPIRECVIFPLMRPENLHSSSLNKEETRNEKKNQETKIVRKLSITRDKAWKFILKHNSEKYDLNHYLESEAVMKALAKKLGENEDYYAMLGLLHDVDWGETKKESTKHLTLAPKLLKELGLDDEFISVVLSHGYGYDCAGLKDKKRTKKIESALACSETITGLIHSYYLMRKSFDGMKAKGLMEKFKDSKFAQKIDRNAIKECELIGVPLAEFMQLSIDAITGIKDKLNL